MSSATSPITGQACVPVVLFVALAVLEPLAALLSAALVLLSAPLL